MFREREMFYLMMHSTHFIYGYMVSDIWLRTILIVRKETRCHHIGYSNRLRARVLLYAPSHSLCYTSSGALAGTRNSSMGPPHEGSIRRPIAPWTNALPLSYVPLPNMFMCICMYVCMCVCVCMYWCMTTSMYCLYVRVDYTYIDVNTLAQGIKSFLASHVWFQAAAGAQTYGTDSPTITSQPH